MNWRRSPWGKERLEADGKEGQKKERREVDSGGGDAVECAYFGRESRDAVVESRRG